MSRRQVVVVTTLPMLFLIGLVVIAPARAGDTADDPAAVATLERAVLAAGVVAFTGVQIVSTAGGAGTGTTRMLELSSQGDGRRWVTVRQAGRAGVSTQVWSAGAQDLGVDPLTLLAGAYTLVAAGTDHVAGRRTDVVIAWRGRQLVARLWVDAQTGLLLRQEVFDGAGAVTRMAAFVQVSPQPTARTLVPRPRAPAGADPISLAAPTEGIDPVAVTALRRESAPCPLTLPGGLVLMDARMSPTSASGAVHLTYSDGLSGLSLFVQVGRLAPVAGASVQDWGGAQVQLAPGWPTRLVWQGGDHVFTLVTDAPADEQRAVVAALPHAAGGGSLLDRVGRGVQAALDLLPGR